MRGEMPILLTLPIRFDGRPRVRRRRRRRAALVSALLLALGIVLVVVGI
jgi:hypothetical protein